MVVATSIGTNQTEVLTRAGERRAGWTRGLYTNPVTVISAIFLLLVVLAAAFAPLLTPYDPTYLDPAVRLQGPSPEHPLGTDDRGRDIFSRVIYGGRVSLMIGVTVTVAAALIGSALGLVSGYFPKLDTPIMRTLDGLMAFPSILLAIAIMASLGTSAVNVFIALVVVYTPTIARLVRSTTLVTRQQPFVESARSIGMTDSQVLLRYVYPNGFSPLIVQCTFVVAFAIISEASLSFLGAGVPPKTPTWGSIVSDGQPRLQQAWWISVFAGSFLFATVLATNLIGDGLRDALDPRSRKR